MTTVTTAASTPTALGDNAANGNFEASDIIAIIGEVTPALWARLIIRRMDTPAQNPLTCPFFRGNRLCLRHGLGWLIVCLVAWGAQPSVAQEVLPPEVAAALVRANVPRDAVSMLVVDAGAPGTVRLSHRPHALMNPASVMKLVTTFAALEVLGPSYSWNTPVYVDGTVRNGTLHGNLVIVGQGDPKLVVERLWLLLRRVQGLGIRAITGDIVLDRSAFSLPVLDPSSFDGEPLKPYNVAPDALLVNYQSVVMTLVPDPARMLATVHWEPPLSGVQLPSSVPLSLGPCADYRAALKGDFSDARAFRLAGTYPASCGEKLWSIAYPDPGVFAARAIQGMWSELGGTVAGVVRFGAASTDRLATPPSLVLRSAPLADIVRDINKFSNNVMAQHLFLTLGRGPMSLAGEATGTPVFPPQVGSFATSRQALLGWWKVRLAQAEPPIVDNGSGLSRSERITADALARLLQLAYASPLMPEFTASLPIYGVDGTLRRVRSRAQGAAHLKTGSLADVVAVAGYVHGANGQRWALVAMVNHPNAQAARPALEALVDWTVGGRP